MLHRWLETVMTCSNDLSFLLPQTLAGQTVLIRVFLSSHHP